MIDKIKTFIGLDYKYHYCLIRNSNRLPFVSTCVHPRFFVFG